MKIIRNKKKHISYDSYTFLYTYIDFEIKMKNIKSMLFFRCEKSTFSSLFFFFFIFILTARIWQFQNNGWVRLVIRGAAGRCRGGRGVAIDGGADQTCAVFKVVRGVGEGGRITLGAFFVARFAETRSYIRVCARAVRGGRSM